MEHVAILACQSAQESTLRDIIALHTFDCAAIFADVITLDTACARIVCEGVTAPLDEDEWLAGVVRACDTHNLELLSAICRVPHENKGIVRAENTDVYLHVCNAGVPFINALVDSGCLSWYDAFFAAWSDARAREMCIVRRESDIFGAPMPCDAEIIWRLKYDTSAWACYVRTHRALRVAERYARLIGNESLLRRLRAMDGASAN